MLEEKHLKAHLQELAGACYCIASASHGTSPEEVRVISENISLFADRKVPSAEVAKLLSKARAEVELHGLSGYLRLIGSRIQEPRARSELLGAAASVVLADREASWEERKVFLELADALGLSDHEAKFILRAVGAPLTGASAQAPAKATDERA